MTTWFLSVTLWNPRQVESSALRELISAKVAAGIVPLRAFGVDGTALVPGVVVSDVGPFACEANASAQIHGADVEPRGTGMANIHGCAMRVCHSLRKDTSTPSVRPDSHP